MNKTTFLTAALLSFYLQGRCQQTFERIYAQGGEAYGASVIQLTDTSYALLCGANSLVPFGHNVVRITIDASGDSIFSNNYCGVFPKKIMLLKDSTIAIASNRTLYCPNGANVDILLVKTNFTGDTIWEQTYGYSNPDYVQGMDTIKDGFVLLSDNSGSFPSFFKTDTSGNFINSGYGHTYMSFGYAIKGTLDGGYIVAGWYGFVPNCWAVEKFDSTGAFQWSTYLGNVSNSDLDDRFRDVIQLPDSDFIACGSYPVTLVKFNHITGDTIWTRTVSYNLWANSLSYTPDGNIIIAGDSKIIKYDTAGNQLWLRYFSNTDLYSIKPTSDGGFIACGAFGNGASSTSVVVIKTDSLGNVSSLIGIDENTFSQNSSNIFPNPVTNISQLNFFNPKNEIFHFSVSDITGRIAEEKEITGSSITIAKGNKPQGVYFYSLVNSKTGERMDGKFLVN